MLLKCTDFTEILVRVFVHRYVSFDYTVLPLRGNSPDNVLLYEYLVG